MLCALTMQALLPGLVAWQLEPASAAVDDVVCDAIYVAALKVGLSGLALGRRTSHVGAPPCLTRRPTRSCNDINLSQTVL